MANNDSGPPSRREFARALGLAGVAATVPACRNKPSPKASPAPTAPAAAPTAAGASRTASRSPLLEAVLAKHRKRFSAADLAQLRGGAKALEKALADVRKFALTADDEPALTLQVRKP